MPVSKNVYEEVVARQGWNAATMRELAERFIAARAMWSEYEVWLEELADEENETPETDSIALKPSHT